MESGIGDSELSAEVDIVLPGNVSFAYKMHSFAYGSFTFYVDNTSALTRNITVRAWQQTGDIPLKVGRHLLRWEFTGGTSTTNK